LFLGSTHQFEEELAEQMGFYIHAGRGTGNNGVMIWLHKHSSKVSESFVFITLLKAIP
jgi:exonuclease III